jgi:hypothetical protein
MKISGDAVLRILRFVIVTLGMFVTVTFYADDLSTQLNHIPIQNQKKSERPPFANTEMMATRLVAAIEKDDPKSVQDLFFPEIPFLLLKDIPNAKQYYGDLTKAFSDDIHRQSTKLPLAKPLQFQKFKPGFCKWKEIGSEYNKIPYWSCYRSEISILHGGLPKIIPVKVIINWGDAWYVTHLGR